MDVINVELTREESNVLRLLLQDLNIRANDAGFGFYLKDEISQTFLKLKKAEESAGWWDE